MTDRTQSITVDGVESEATAITCRNLFFGRWSSSHIQVTSLMFSTALVFVIICSLMIIKSTAQLRSLISKLLGSTSATVSQMCMIGVQLDACNSTLQRQSSYGLVAVQARARYQQKIYACLCVKTLWHPWLWGMTLASTLTLNLPWGSKSTASHVAFSIWDESARSDAPLVQRSLRGWCRRLFSIYLTTQRLISGSVTDNTITAVARSECCCTAHCKLQDHIPPAMKQLHWLPINLRSTFKLCLMMQSIPTQQCPDYMCELTMPTAVSSTKAGLHLSFWKPKVQTKFGEHAFSYSGPVAINALPYDIQSITVTNSFRRQLRTRLFAAAY